MATMTIEYDEHNKSVIQILEGLISSGLIKKKEKGLSGFERSMKDIKEGKVYEAKSVADLMNKINAE